MIQPVSVTEAKSLLHSGREIALLDVREAAAFGEGHPLFASHAPYSRLEMLAGALVPRAKVPVLLIDDGDGVAELAARRLADCGYTDLRPICGGMPAWARRGYGVFAGVNVPGKTLGELLEHSRHTKIVRAETLSEWQSEKRPFHLFDVRPPGEYAKMRIPGASCVPNGELAHRFAALVADPSIPVVLTCAGRTRGLVGALGLSLAQVPNPILALENGTQGWALAGFPLERGASAGPLPTLDDDAMAVSRARADRVLGQEGIAEVAPGTVARLLAEPDRTTFVFDLRTEAERMAQPVAGAVPVLGGQLVQATDAYMAVRHARVVLVDDAGLRAATAAVWLRALGFDPVVARVGGEQPLKPLRPWAPTLPPALRPISPFQGRHIAESGVPVLDLRPSDERDAAAIEGALWSVRPRLRYDLPQDAGRVVAITGDAAVAALASLDLRDAGIELLWLAFDKDALVDAGWRIVAAPPPLSREAAVDQVWFAHGRHDGDREASLLYLAWERGLVDQLDEAERREFLVTS